MVCDSSMTACDSKCAIRIIVWALALHSWIIQDPPFENFNLFNDKHEKTISYYVFVHLMNQFYSMTDGGFFLGTHNWGAEHCELLLIWKLRLLFIFWSSLPDIHSLKCHFLNFCWCSCASSHRIGALWSHFRGTPLRVEKLCRNTLPFSKMYCRLCYAICHFSMSDCFHS